MKRILVLLALVVLLTGCQMTGMAVKDTEPTIRFGASISPWSTLVYIADENGFFEEEGLNVEVSQFTSGKVAHETLIGGGLDIATSPDIPIIASTFIKPDNFKIIANIMRTNNGEKLLVLNDKIKEPKDLEGKTIARLHTSTSHYFSSQFMEKYDIDDEKIEFVNLKPIEMAAALEAGALDGYFAWEPFIYYGKQAKGDEVFVYEDQTLYPATMAVAVSTEMIENNPEDVKAVLRALIKAEEFVKENPVEAKQTLIDLLSFELESLDALWDDYDYTIQLDQTLIDTMEKQQEWALEEGIQNSEIDPIMNYIDSSLLKEVKPEAVTI